MVKFLPESHKTPPKKLHPSHIFFYFLLFTSFIPNPLKSEIHPPSVRQIASMASGAGSSRGKGKKVKTTTSGPRTKVLNDEFNSRNFKLFEKRSIVEGRFVDFTEFRELDIERLFEVLGWKSFVEVKEQVYPRLVKAFYAHMNFNTCEMNVQIVCTLKGQRIELDKEVISKIFEIPDVGRCVHTYDSWAFNGEAMSRIIMERDSTQGDDEEDDEAIPPKPKANELPLRSRILHHIISNNIIPRGGHRDEISFTDLYLIFCLLEGIRTNLPFLILHKMADGNNVARDPNLPYGMALTRIFRYFKVNLDDETEISPPKSDYNKTTIKLMGYKFQNGRWISKKRGRVENEEHEEDLGGSSTQFNDGAFNTLHGRIESLCTSHDELKLQVQNGFQNLYSYVDTSMTNLRNDLLQQLQVNHQANAEVQAQILEQLRHLNFRGPPPSL